MRPSTESPEYEMLVEIYIHTLQTRTAHKQWIAVRILVFWGMESMYKLVSQGSNAGSREVFILSPMGLEKRESVQ